MTIPANNIKVDHILLHGNKYPVSASGRQYNFMEEAFSIFGVRNTGNIVGKCGKYACNAKAHPTIWATSDMTGTYSQTPFGSTVWGTDAAAWDSYYLNCANNSGYTFSRVNAPTDFDGNNEYTIELYFLGRPLHLNSPSFLFGNHISGGGVGITMSNGNKFALISGINQATSYGSDVSPDTVRMYSVIVVGSNAKNLTALFVDGNKLALASFIPFPAANFSIGSNLNGAATNLVEFRIARTALYDPSHSSITPPTTRWNT